MSEKKADFSRRDFLKTVGAVGLGSMIAPIENIAHDRGLYAANESLQNIVPTRPFGKTGVEVSILGLGLALYGLTNLFFKQALKMGVTYWDTAPNYYQSEEAIGKYFSKFPEDRKKVFLVTKAETTATHRLSSYLEGSLETMKTDYIDLYLIHAVSNVKRALDQDVKKWAERAKAEGKIRFFGFSIHKNMEKGLAEASKLGWIDGILTTYNYRWMNTDSMKRAVDDCVKAGIGLTAMKTQAKRMGGYGEVGEENATNVKIAEKFVEKGFTPEQAKLRAVWENPNIASICSHMTNMTILQTNVAAASSKTKLSFQDRQLLEEYARETASHYCTGCSHNCEPTLNNEVPISNVMRYLMYSRCYGEPERAKSAFKRLPSKIRKSITDIDYRKAELKCPQGMQIGQLMKEAASELV